MSLQEDFLASHSAMPASAEARRMTAISGRTCLELLEKSGRAGSWAKTFTALLTGMEGWFSTRCYLTWKLKATKSGRMFCQLQVSMPRITGTGFGSSPSIVSIPPYGRRKLIPTPIALDGTSADFAIKLRRQEKPESADKLTAYLFHNWQKLAQTEEQSSAPIGEIGRVNPRFVAEMMGFPVNWTEKPLKSGEHNP